jgi:hypothetical protein
VNENVARFQRQMNVRAAGCQKGDCGRNRYALRLVWVPPPMAYGTTPGYEGKLCNLPWT